MPKGFTSAKAGGQSVRTSFALGSGQGATFGFSPALPTLNSFLIACREKKGEDPRNRGQAHAQANWWLCAILFFGFPSAAAPQTPSLPVPVTRYDGRYAFVSATKVNEYYHSGYTNRIGLCGDVKKGLLVITNGQAQLPIFQGKVGPQGELDMRYVSIIRIGSGTPGWERVIHGQIDVNGTVRAREISRNCNYDLIWQKVIK